MRNVLLEMNISLFDAIYADAILKLQRSAIANDVLRFSPAALDVRWSLISANAISRVILENFMAGTKKKLTAMCHYSWELNVYISSQRIFFTIAYVKYRVLG